MIYTILKTTYVKKEPKIITYYEKLSQKDFLAEVNYSLQTSKIENWEEFEETITKILDKLAPNKTAVVRENSRPHMTKEPKKAMMSQARLKNIANKTNRQEDIADTKLNVIL